MKIGMEQLLNLLLLQSHEIIHNQDQHIIWGRVSDGDDNGGDGDHDHDVILEPHLPGVQATI